MLNHNKGSLCYVTMENYKVDYYNLLMSNTVNYTWHTKENTKGIMNAKSRDSLVRVWCVDASKWKVRTGDQKCPYSWENS